MTEKVEGFKPDTGVAAADNDVIEAEARKGGWIPKDEFKGDAAKWRPAKEFLEIGQNIDIRKQNRELREKVQNLEQVTSSFKPFMDQAITRAQRERDKAIADLKALQDDAIETGDKKAYRKATDELEKVQKEAPVASASQPVLSPVSQAFVDRNSDWWSVNGEARALADGLAPQIQHEKPGLSEAEFLAELEARVLKVFPRRETRQRMSEVESGDRGGQSSGRKTFDNLPPEAQKECDRFVGEIPNFSREDYVKSYEWET